MWHFAEYEDKREIIHGVMAIHSIQGKANFLIGSDREPWHLLMFLGLEECFNWFGGLPIASQRGYGEKKNLSVGV